MSATGNVMFKPNKEEMINFLKMIEQSKVIAIDSIEYTMQPILKNGEVDHNLPWIDTGHREITFHIQQSYRSTDRMHPNRIAKGLSHRFPKDK